MPGSTQQQADVVDGGLASKSNLEIVVELDSVL
jgi:hypothetical protein